MEIKDLYLKKQNYVYAQIKEIKDKTLELKSNPIEKLKDNWLVVLIIFVVIIGLLLINFNLKYFLVSMGLVLALFVLFIYGNKYTIKCDTQTLNISQNFQKTKLPYECIKSIYMVKSKGWILFIPRNIYKLIIRCEDNFSFLREFEYPLLCTNSEELEQFMENIIVEEKIEEKFVKYQKKKFWKRFLENAITVIIGVLIFYYLYKAGSINFNF